MRADGLCVEPRYAWWGRTSTEDEQDPTLSLPRQYRNCEGPVERSGGRIVACFYDIESGAGGYEGRGSRKTMACLGVRLPLPRDGGLRELLGAAAGRPRPFDRVIVESIGRLSRNSSVTFRIEEDLLQFGVRLCAADEPLEENFGTIVLRHVNVGIARGYHHELMVKSREGAETSVRQGWHAGGIALYGYVLAGHDHPNPRKAARGVRKRTLEPDPVRAPVVRHIYALYLSGGLGVTQIADGLNEDPDRFPPPTGVDAARSLNRWSRTSVWEVLHNPKYTGYQVWNRRARKKGGNRINPPGDWVWSEEPAHPAIISREEYDAVRWVAAHNMRSRRGDLSAETAEGRGRAVYLYRGRLRCGLCGRRMWGNHRRTSTYYSCQPKGRAASIHDHPANVYLNEKRLNTAVFGFLNTTVFGPDRADYWRDCITAPDANDAAALASRAAELIAEISELERKVTRQVINLEADDLTPTLRRRITQRVSELEAAITDRRQRHRDVLRKRHDPTPAVNAEALLERLPIITAPVDPATQDALRRLYDSIRLTITYQPKDDAIDVEISLATPDNLSHHARPAARQLRRLTQRQPRSHAEEPA